MLLDRAILPSPCPRSSAAPAAPARHREHLRWPRRPRGHFSRGSDVLLDGGLLPSPTPCRSSAAPARPRHLRRPRHPRTTSRGAGGGNAPTTADHVPHGGTSPTPFARSARLCPARCPVGHRQRPPRPPTPACPWLAGVGDQKPSASRWTRRFSIISFFPTSWSF